MMKRSSSGVKRKSMLAMSALMQTLLPATSRTGDEQMRHLCEIGNDGLAVNVLAERERNSTARFCFFPIRAIRATRAT